VIYSDAFRKIMRKEKASFELEAFLRAEVRAGYLGKAKDKVFLYPWCGGSIFCRPQKRRPKSYTRGSIFCRPHFCLIS
jgi:hypothetical protein